MKKLIFGCLAAMVMAGIALPDDVDARRVGGGRSFSVRKPAVRSASPVPSQTQTTSPAKAAPVQQAPGAVSSSPAPAPAPAAAATPAATPAAAPTATPPASSSPGIGRTITQGLVGGVAAGVGIEAARSLMGGGEKGVENQGDPSAQQPVQAVPASGEMEKMLAEADAARQAAEARANSEASLRADMEAKLADAQRQISELQAKLEASTNRVQELTVKLADVLTKKAE